MLDDVMHAIKKLCPFCKQAHIFPKFFDFTPYKNCPKCGHDLHSLDVGDEAIVFLIFILGFSLIPAAIVWEFASSPPIGLQFVVWGIIGFVAIFVLTPIIKTYIMILQRRHRG